MKDINRILLVAIVVLYSCKVELDINKCRNKTLPVLTTNPADNITNTTATLGGNITNAGCPPYTERGVCYSTLEYPTIAYNRTPVAGTGTGSFNVDVSLEPNTIYFVRAYVINSDGTVYYSVEQERFKTEGSPKLNTTPVTTFTATTATLGGSITCAGYPEYTERGVCYSTSQYPTIANNRTPVAGTGVGSFSVDVSISDLDTSITYHVRAYVIYSEEPVYGNDVIFKTENAPKSKMN